MPEWVPALADPEAIKDWRKTLNRASRRRAEREDRRRAKRIDTLPMTLADIPEGSMLSEQTVAAITAGQYVFKRETVPNTRPSWKERQWQGRRDRILNQIAIERS